MMVFVSSNVLKDTIGKILQVIVSVIVCIVKYR